MAINPQDATFVKGGGHMILLLLQDPPAKPAVLSPVLSWLGRAVRNGHTAPTNRTISTGHAKPAGHTAPASSAGQTGPTVSTGSAIPTHHSLSTGLLWPAPISTLGRLSFWGVCHWSWSLWRAQNWSHPNRPCSRQCCCGEMASSFIYPKVIDKRQYDQFSLSN